MCISLSLAHTHNPHALGSEIAGGIDECEERVASLKLLVDVPLSQWIQTTTATPPSPAGETRTDESHRKVWELIASTKLKVSEEATRLESTLEIYRLLRGTSPPS